MPRDLFEERGIKVNTNRQPRDLFAERGITIPKKGWAGIGQDVMTGIGNIPSAIYGMAAEAPGEIYGAGKQIFENPQRALQNFGQGAVNFGEGVANLYPNVRDYLRKKEITQQTSPDIYKRHEHIDIGELTGRGGPQAGDKLLSALAENVIPGLLGSRQIAGATKAAGKIATAPVKSIGRGIKNIHKGTPKRFAPLIEKDVKSLKSEANKIYTNLDKRASKAGVSSIFEQSPTTELIEYVGKPKVNSDIAKKLNYSYLKKHLKGDALESFRKFLKDDSFSNARELSTALRLEKEALSKSPVRLPETNRAIRKIGNAKNKLDKNLSKALERSADPGLALEYQDIQKWYGKNVAPLVHNKNVNKYLKSGKSEFSQKKLFERLKKDEMFQDILGEKYPQLHSRDTLKKIGKIVGYGSGGLYGANELSKYLRGSQ